MQFQVKHACSFVQSGTLAAFTRSSFVGFSHSVYSCACVSSKCAGFAYLICGLSWRKRITQVLKCARVSSQIRGNESTTDASLSPSFLPFQVACTKEIPRISSFIRLYRNFHKPHQCSSPTN